MGGDGGSSGDAGDVTVQHRGDIFTHGGGSDGILAQSISGGGGSGALNVTGAFLKDSSAVSLAIGGRGGDGGNAGDVSVTHDGTIVTEGANSAAIRAQSIGVWRRRCFSRRGCNYLFRRRLAGRCRDPRRAQE